ncbi:MAG: hypothetical protein ACI9UR_001846 [Bacteroidia bacterium]|jgi:hypothetical protein
MDQRANSFCYFPNKKVLIFAYLTIPDTIIIPVSKLLGCTIPSSLWKLGLAVTTEPVVYVTLVDEALTSLSVQA